MGHESSYPPRIFAQRVHCQLGIQHFDFEEAETINTTYTTWKSKLPPSIWQCKAIHKCSHQGFHFFASFLSLPTSSLQPGPGCRMIFIPSGTLGKISKDIFHRWCRIAARCFVLASCAAARVLQEWNQKTDKTLAEMYRSQRRLCWSIICQNEDNKIYCNVLGTPYKERTNFRSWTFTTLLAKDNTVIPL